MMVVVPEKKTAAFLSLLSTIILGVVQLVKLLKTGEVDDMVTGAIVGGPVAYAGSRAAEGMAHAKAAVNAALGKIVPQ